MGVGERPRRFVLQHFTPGQGSHGAGSCRDGRSAVPTGEAGRKDKVGVALQWRDSWENESKLGEQALRGMGERE